MVWLRDLSCKYWFWRVYLEEIVHLAVISFRAFAEKAFFSTVDRSRASIA